MVPILTVDMAADLEPGALLPRYCSMFLHIAIVCKIFDITQIPRRLIGTALCNGN